MKITVQSSKVVKPTCYGSGSPPTTTDSIPLTVFDTVTYDKHVSGIYYFHPPAPPNAVLENGLVKAMVVYREWAGRLGTDAKGNRAILLNDAGARFVEAISDVALSSIDPLEPLPELLSLCPSGKNSEELMLVQVTRFTCGSFAVGTTAHHMVADGLARCSFMLAWGKAARGIAMDPIPLHDRGFIFAPQNPPRVEFEHRSVEFKPRTEVRNTKTADSSDNLVVNTVHFTPEMVWELKSRASVGAPRPYSSLQCVAAHLWRCITKARGLDRDKLTKLKIPVNGRSRMRNPQVPDDYAGNLVLWAQPTTTAGELLGKPLQYAVELLSRSVARMDNSYFRSFIDFATSEAVEKEGLVPADTVVSFPDVFLSNLKGIPMYDLDYGTGRPFLYTRSHPPWEGYVFIMPPLCNDGSMDVQVTLFSHAMDIFKDCCYSLEAADTQL